MRQHTLPANVHLNTLAEFRQNAYVALGPARDALFELADAVLLMRAANSFVELSTCPVFLYFRVQSQPSLI